ncbi:UDP-N-acetylglucosamine 2-epimerase (plasmid) [Streptomyces sp. AHU1]|uniref:UDP-N-acetylglucosamine 2-epimerase n=1 Tax=Streptomyces sp. AHU1 TaxID=3377215 RepID=UPI00387823DD
MHCYYQLCLVNRPVAGRQVRLDLQARRLLCSNISCGRRTFAEQIPDLTRRHARRTNTLTTQLTDIALFLGGRAGASLCGRLTVTFSRLLSRARLVITDSGGIQEEAAAFGLPVLVTRENTERIEELQQRVARLVETRETDIVAAAKDELAHDHHDPGDDDQPRPYPNPYGDGRAGERCAAACGWLLGHTDRPAEWQPAKFADAHA